MGNDRKTPESRVMLIGLLILSAVAVLLLFSTVIFGQGLIFD